VAVWCGIFVERWFWSGGVFCVLVVEGESMGAQRSNEEDLDELDIVVDISRDKKVRGPARKVAAMDETDSERRSSSSGTVGTSEGTRGRGKDEEMEEVSEEGPALGKAIVASKLKPHQVEAVEEADEEALPRKNGSVREGNSAPQESDSPAKQNGRKRKKTIHFKNSRVPHAIPTLESESEEEESGSHEEAGELPVRHAPGPRSTASKV